MTLTEPFEEKSLTLVVKKNYSGVFIGNKKFGYLRRLHYTTSVNKTIPDINISLIGFQLNNTDLPKIDDNTFTLVQRNFVDDISSSFNVVTFVGETIFGFVQKIDVDIDAEYGTHIQIDFPDVYQRENSHKLNKDSMRFVDELEQNVNKLKKLSFVKIGWTKIGV